MMPSGSDNITTIVPAGAGGALTTPELLNLSSGNLLALWRAPAGLYTQEMGQILDSTGQPVGTAFVVDAAAENMPGTGFRDAAYAATSDGGFAATWEAEPIVSAQGSAVFLQRFGPTGTPIGDFTQVANPMPGSLLGLMPVIAGLADGGVALAWNSTQNASTLVRLDSGNNIASLQNLDGDTSPMIAGLSNGRIAVSGLNSLQIYNADDTPVGSTVTLGAGPSALYENISATGIYELSDGHIFVTVFDVSYSTQTINYYGDVIDASGTVTARIPLESYDSIAPLAGGNFVETFTEPSSDLTRP